MGRLPADVAEHHPHRVARIPTIMPGDLVLDAPMRRRGRDDENGQARRAEGPLASPEIRPLIRLGEMLQHHARDDQIGRRRIVVRGKPIFLQDREPALADVAVEPRGRESGRLGTHLVADAGPATIEQHIGHRPAADADLEESTRREVRESLAQVHPLQNRPRRQDHCSTPWAMRRLTTNSGRPFTCSKIRAMYSAATPMLTIVKPPMIRMSTARLVQPSSAPLRK